MSPVLIAAMQPAVIGFTVLLIVGIVVLVVLKRPKAKASDQPTPRVKQHWLLDPEAENGAASWHIGQRIVSVGRAPANFVQVNSPGISRMHCQLQPTPEGLKVVDMTSSNGTTVNGEPVQQCLLKDRDILSVGDSNFLYRTEGDFGANAGFRAKDAGRDTEDETNLVDAKAYSLLMKAHLAYAENDEDMAKTAEQLDITMHELRELIGD